MKVVKDFIWKNGMSVEEFVNSLSSVGFQSINIKRASEIILSMKKSGAKIFLTFSSNLVTSGLRGLFAQMIRLGLVDAIVTTAGGIEEDIMKANSEEFLITDYNADDLKLYEDGMNRIGNLIITNESYEKFEDLINAMLMKLYEKKHRWSVSEMLMEFGLMLKDKNSILYQAAKNNVPVFCPAITDSALGFHLFMLQQKHNDFVVDVVDDFKRIVLFVSQDDKKGVIALGGGVSKHHALLACLLNGGLDYAVYITTSHQESGSMSSATTNEAKSWGKIKDDSEAVTMIGDATIIFPLVIIPVFEELFRDKIINSD
ncbi:MAG: deoxyhypusine synthase [Candidatus Woesearchaeota archaeon]